MYNSFDSAITNYHYMQFQEIIQMDAFLLWKQFCLAYKKKQYNELEQETLKKKDRDITLGKNEEMHKYIIQYQNLECELRENGLEVDIKIGKTKAYKFIFSLCDLSHAHIVKQIVSRANVDYNNLSFQAIHWKLLLFIEVETEVKWYQNQRKQEEKKWQDYQAKKKQDNDRKR